MSTTIGFAGEAPPGEGVEMAKGPRDEDDPNQLRRFAKRIAEMKWWNNHSNSDKPEATQVQGKQSGSGQSQVPSDDQQTPAGDQQQQTSDNKPSSEGETS
jgi:hypothetical protein